MVFRILIFSVIIKKELCIAQLFTAEEEGFEPPVPIKVRLFSRQVH